MILNGSRRRHLLVTLAFLAGASVLILLGAMSSRDPSEGEGNTPGPIRSSEPGEGFVVAAVQFSSRMGEAEWNRERLLALVAEAALSGADVVVLPETAVQGYMTPDGEGVWCAPDFPDRDFERSLEGIAEPVPGPSTWAFGSAAMAWGVYVVAPLIERDPETGKYFNTAVLLGPHGNILLHYRKINPWTPAEYAWASGGEDVVPVVDTPLGRLGLMICFDVHSMFAPLAKAEADCILAPVWWVDPDPALWFGERLPALCGEYGVACAVANRAQRGMQGELPGAGYSRIIGADGRVLAEARTKGTEVVMARISPLRAP